MCVAVGGMLEQLRMRMQLFWPGQGGQQQRLSPYGAGAARR